MLLREEKAALKYKDEAKPNHHSERHYSFGGDGNQNPDPYIVMGPSPCWNLELFVIWIQVFLAWAHISLEAIQLLYDTFFFFF